MLPPYLLNQYHSPTWQDSASGTGFAVRQPITDQYADHVDNPTNHTRAQRHRDHPIRIWRGEYSRRLLACIGFSERYHELYRRATLPRYSVHHHVDHSE